MACLGAAGGGEKFKSAGLIGPTVDVVALVGFVRGDCADERANLILQVRVVGCAPGG